MQYVPSLLRTPTGTITDGAACEDPATWSKGETVEQYSIGLFGLGCKLLCGETGTPAPEIFF